ncbi:Efflux pump mlcE [Lachnellula cervina]|uniref:Efflux pump mlcE n=1 Tax=Lachnellula cervina TaxID=1316786 RepID=A0A7D8UPD5_9HELO|nr:Efflux pump mlcE [Lachnellula cervina]
MEKRESSETEVAIGSDTNEPHYKPINESVKEPSYATKDEQASTTDDKTEDSSNLQPAQTNASEDGWHYVTGMKLYLVIGMVTLACFIMLLDTSIVATAIPSITSDFHSLGDVGWYGSSYLICSCALQPLTGKIYSRFSSKWVFMFFLFLFELGSMITALATSSNMFIVGRAVAGMGGSGLVNGALTIISACVPLHKRAAYLGFMMSFGQIGILVGPLIGGALTEYTTWRWCFWINLPAGGVTALILFFINIPSRIEKIPFRNNVKATLVSLDLPGFFLFAPTAIMLLFALQWGGTKYAWGSATIIGLFCGSGGLFAVFVAWEYKKGDDAMIPFSMMKIRIVWCSCLIMLFFFGTQIVTSYYLALYFQAVRGVTPTLSGVYLLPTILSQMLLAVIAGVLVGRLGYYMPWAITSGVLSAIGSGLLATFTPTTSTGTWIGFQIIGAVGRGCGMQMPIIAVQNVIPSKQTSVGMSIIAFCQTLGGAMFLSFAQTGFNTGLKEALHQYAPEVSAEAVAAAGATGFRHIIPAPSVPGVIHAYSQAINHVFYIAAGAAAASFVASWGIGWKSIKKAKTVKPEV